MATRERPDVNERYELLRMAREQYYQADRQINGVNTMKP